MSSLFEAAAPTDETADTNLFGEAEPVITTAAAVETGAYRVLARKYRPQNFKDLVGQDVLVKTLTNAFASGRLAQAWMMTGVRGVGKTTTARIIAKGLNCTGPDGHGPMTIDPCGVCHTCRAITEDRCVDVLEVDAASRTGVDDMREILDGVRYAPVSARYKVYIIDEVHMLSKNAFNALLKTLEEPPSHAKFIFATTEIRKVPVTVLSRCQRFDLRRIESQRLYDYFQTIVEAEGFNIEPEALRLIARAADGSARDGLSLLDQAMALSEDRQIQAAAVNGMLGLADRSHVIELYAALTTGQPAAALDKFDSMLAAGADALTVLHDIADLTHLLTRGKVLPELAADTTIPELDRHAMQRLLPQHTLAGLTRLWQILMKGIGEVQQALQPQQAAAMVLVRLAYAANMPPPGDLMGKLNPTGQEGGSPSSSGSYSSGAGNPTGNPNGSMLRAVGGTRTTFGNAAVALSVAEPSMAEPARNLSPISQPDSLPDTAPRPNVISALSLSLAADFKNIIALCKEKREMALAAELHAQARLVALQPGRLELIPGARSSPNFAGKLGQCLSNWTGDRWIVSIARVANPAEANYPTVAEAEAATDALRREAALADPIVAATLQAFQGAQLLYVKPRAPAASSGAADSPKNTDEDNNTTDEEA